MDETLTPRLLLRQAVKRQPGRTKGKEVPRLPESTLTLATCSGGGTVVVAEYNPAGNYIGQKPY
jgi:hypothetical protein